MTRTNAGCLSSFYHSMRTLLLPHYTWSVPDCPWHNSRQEQAVDTGGHFRAFTQPDYLTCIHLLSSKLYRFTMTWLPLPRGRFLPEQGRQKVLSVLAKQMLAATSFRHDWSRSLHILKHFFLCSSLISRIYAPARISTTVFSCNLFKITFSFWEATFLASSSFQHQSLCSSRSKPGHCLRQKHDIWSDSSLLDLSQACWLIVGFGLLIGGFGMCLYLLAWMRSEFTTEQHQLQSASSRLLLQSSEVQFQTLTYRPSYLPAVCAHSSGYFFT